MDNVATLEALYERLDAIQTVVARATIVELCRESQGGLTDSRIDYWIHRLTELLNAH